MPTGVWDPGGGHTVENIACCQFCVGVRTTETNGWMSSVAKAKSYYGLLTINFLGGVHSEQ